MFLDQKVSILSSVFVAALVAANLMGSKIITILGVSASVGIFAFPLTYMISDTITEVLGKRRANQMVYGALAAQAVIFIILAIAIILPPASRFTNNDSYVAIFGNSLRIIVASLTAFALGQINDIFSFSWLKEKTSGKMLWLRTNLSTAFGQFIDTTVFMFIAFYHFTPKYDAAFIFSLIIPYWGLKILYSIVDTPIVYGLVAWLRRSPSPSTQGERD